MFFYTLNSILSLDRTIGKVKLIPTIIRNEPISLRSIARTSYHHFYIVTLREVTGTVSPV